VAARSAACFVLAPSTVSYAAAATVRLHLPRSVARAAPPAIPGEGRKGVWGKPGNRAAWGASGGLPGFPHGFDFRF
jgi:hypothetical protein